MASITFGELKRYISQWLKDTPGQTIDEPLLEAMINFVLVDIYSETDLKKVSTEFTVTAGTTEFSLSTLGVSDSLMRPLYLFIDGIMVPDYDFEQLHELGYISGNVSDTKNPSAYAQNWELGYLKLYLVGTVTGSVTAQLIYSAIPTPLNNSNQVFEANFMPQWKETIAWGVLYRRLASAPEKQQIEEGVRYNLQMAQQEYLKRMEEIKFDATYERTRVYTWKARGPKNHADDLLRNFTYR